MAAVGFGKFRGARGSCLLVFIVLVTVLFVLRAFFNVSFRSGSSFARAGSTEISMLTFNIWFSYEKMRERMEALGQIVQDLKPDILAFQEVTLDNLAVLQEQRWFSRYQLIPPDVASQGSRSFVVILSVYPVEKWLVHPFKNSLSKYNRRLVLAETKNTVPSSNVGFVIAATHLAHAGFGTRLREEQLKESFRIISDYDNICFMGDLNIEDKVDGDIVLPSPWFDAWLSIPGNSNNNGYTWDRNKTPFASVIKRTVNATSYQARLDRVLCKLSDFKVKEMRIVGDQVTKTGVLPSDHFGLFTVIERLEKSEHKNEKQTIQTDNQVYFKRPNGWERLIK